jgi:hypothetical protein
MGFGLVETALGNERRAEQESSGNVIRCRSHDALQVGRGGGVILGHQGDARIEQTCEK